MARTSTLLQLRTWARQLAAIEGNPNVTDPELTALANRHLTEVYDALVDAGPPEYYAATTTITSIAGTTVYGLPADFRTLLEVYAVESTTEVRLVHPMGHGQRGRYRSPTGVWDCQLEYVPVAPTLVNDGDTFDGVSGWEELIANLMARDCMIKLEADPSPVLGSIGALQSRIGMRARSRDKGHPRYAADLDAQGSVFPWSSTTNSRISVYRLRGNNIELYEGLWGLP